jgi:hypothetical protein
MLLNGLIYLINWTNGQAGQLSASALPLTSKIVWH